MKEVKILGETTMLFQQSSEVFFKLQVPKGFSFDKLTKDEQKQLWDLLKEFVKKDESLLEWAEGAWQMGQSEPDGSCPPFDLDSLFEILEEFESLDNYFVELVEV